MNPINQKDLRSGDVVFVPEAQNTHRLFLVTENVFDGYRVYLSVLNLSFGTHHKNTRGFADKRKLFLIN